MSKTAVDPTEITQSARTGFTLDDLERLKVKVTNLRFEIS